MSCQESRWLWHRRILSVGGCWDHARASTSTGEALSNTCAGLEQREAEKAAGVLSQVRTNVCPRENVRDVSLEHQRKAELNPIV